MTPAFSHLRWVTEGVRLVAYILIAAVFLRRAGVDVIGRVRRWIGVEAVAGGETTR